MSILRQQAASLAGIVLLMGAAQLITVVPSAVAASESSVHLQDAYARPGTNACSWTLGSTGIEKVLSFSEGTFRLTSFVNKLAEPARQYVDEASPSEEFRFTWDGQTLSGASGGWTCAAGKADQVLAGGEPALQVDITLTRSAVSITKHYLVYPVSPVIREWVEYRNTDTAAHTLARPSFLAQHLMGGELGDVDLYYMQGAHGAGGPSAGPESYKLIKEPLTAAWKRRFNTYDQFGCTGPQPDPPPPPAPPPPCTVGAYDPNTMSSTQYMPWFSLWNRRTASGVYMGFSYNGNWEAPIGAFGAGHIDFSLVIANYDSALAAGQSITSPQAFVGVYVTDLDDMTNRLLDYQYRYLWDYTRADYFARVRWLGDWTTGSFIAGPLDQVTELQKIFDYTDRMRAVGADTYHQDYGWWDAIGDWNGPDFRISNNYLARSGMKHLVYMYIYNAHTDSQNYRAHPHWFVGARTPGLDGNVLDLNVPDAEQWMGDFLLEKAAQWGPFQWRNDSGFMAARDGAWQLGQDQGLRRVLKRFLDACQGCAFQGVNSGGNEINYELVRLASGYQFQDRPFTWVEHNGASMLFPTDKISLVPEGADVAKCDASMNRHLAWNPNFNSDTIDPQRLECVRKVIDKYHYMVAHGVAGRWVRQYHPHATDDPRFWFERLSRDGSRGILHYMNEQASGTSVTVFPKGLDPRQRYDVRFELAPGSASRTGADLMANGVTLAEAKPGEMVYLNLPNHPGSGTDHDAPGAPSRVEVTAGTQMNYPGVEISWQAGRDNEWVSYYEVLRDGKLIGKVAKGIYYFDHTPGASPMARYTVRTVDGDGNKSSEAKSQPRAPHMISADDAAAAVTYTGQWRHARGLVGPHEGTQSEASVDVCTPAPSSSPATASWTFTGSQVTYYAKLGHDAGKVAISIDGRPDAVVDLFAGHGNFVAETFNYSVPVYTKTFPGSGTHTITVSPAKEKNPSSGGMTVNLDGFAASTAAPSVIENTSPEPKFVGAGWQLRPEQAASGGSVHATAGAGDTVELRFKGRGITWVGPVGPRGGEADVYLDGTYVTRVDAYGFRGPTLSQSALFQKTFAGPGWHTIRIVATGTKNPVSSGTDVAVDSFHVLR